MQLSIVPLDQNNPIPQNITSHPTNDEETSEISSSTSFSSFCFPDLIGEFHKHYTTEHFITTTFLWITASTSFGHLLLGLELLEKTGLSNSVSVKVMSFFKYFFAIFTSYSHISSDTVFRSFKLNPVLTKRRYYGTWLALPLVHSLVPVTIKYRRIVYYSSSVLYVACVGAFGGHKKYVNFVIFWLMLAITFPVAGRGSSTSDTLLLKSVITSFRAAQSDIELLISSASSLVCFLDKRVQKLMPVATACVRAMLKERKKIGKFIKYAIGLGGTLFFQNFIRVTTFSEVKAFMYLATSWLANLTLINATGDFGVLNFMLGNMILSSTVSQSGLGITTWFTYGICIFLYILRIKLKSMNNTSHNMEKLIRPPIMFWIFYSCTILDWLWNIIP